MASPEKTLLPYAIIMPLSPRFGGSLLPPSRGPFDVGVGSWDASKCLGAPVFNVGLELKGGCAGCEDVVLSKTELQR